MQNVDGYPTSLDVTEPTALVVIDGVPREPSSLSVTRELSSSLPAQVSAASGITAATGKVSWAVGDDVQSRTIHPWDGNNFPPRPADAAVVFAGYGEALVRQLTGSVDDTQGSIAAGDLSSDLVDRIDKLNRNVSYPAILSVMPPIEEGGAPISVGMRPTYLTDRVLRECGFYATPPQSNGCVLSAPLMGSTWPEVGTATRSSQQGDTESMPTFDPTPWGVALSSGDTDYAPDLSRASNNGRITRTVQLTLKVNPAQGSGGQSFLRAYWGSAFIMLTVFSGRSVFAYLNNGTSTTTLCSLSSAQAASANVFNLQVTPDGDVTLQANNGQSATGSVTVPSAMTGGDVDKAQVYVEHNTGVRIGGAQISFRETNVVNSPQTATLTPSASVRTLHTFPRVEPTNALDLLKEQAEAECAAMWIDEHGHFRWVNRQELATTVPSATLTALDDVLDIGWSSSASGVRSRVLVQSRESSVSRSRMSNQLAWQGGGPSLEEGEILEEIATPPADTDWVGVDEDLKLLPQGGAFSDFNRGRGTWAGAVATDDESSQWATIDNPGFSVTLEKITDAVYKFTTDPGSPPAGRTIELRTPDEESTTAVWRSKRNFDLPVLRAKAIIEWAERETWGLHVGPEDAAILEHDVGAWVQHPIALQELADWLSLQVFEPKPVLRDLSVIPDFRRQLGDVVWVEDAQNMRIRLKLLITKITTSVSAGSADQSVAGRILEVRSLAVTNEQLDEHSAGRTNTDFDILWADATNAQLDSNPLGRG